MSLVASQSSVTAATAQRLVAAAAEAAEAAGRPMSIAVVDASGALRAFLRMDGAYLGSVQIAQDKAYSAAAFLRPTSVWTGAIANDAGLAGLPGAADRLVTLGGGLPLTVDGEVVGGIGLSGGHYSQDAEIAEAAIKAVLGG